MRTASPAPLPPLPAERRASLAWAALVLVAALLAFQPALHNSYSLDDLRQVATRVAPANGQALLATLGQPWWPLDSGKALWRPLASFSLSAQAMLHTGWPAGFYGFNLLLHAAVSLALFALARALGGSPRAAGLAGLLAAAHPLHAEAVHQVVGRAETLAALGMLLGLAAFAHALGRACGGAQGSATSPPATRGAARRALLAQALVQPLCFALALGGKEHALLYPLYLALLLAATPAGRALLARPRGKMAALALLLALGLQGGVFLLLRMQVAGGALVTAHSVLWIDNPLYAMPPGARAAGAIGGLAIAAGQCLGLVPLATDYGAYSFPYQQGWGWPAAGLGAALLLALLAGLAWELRRACRAAQDAGARQRGAATAALIAAGLAGWGLTSNLPFAIGACYAERLLYWPLLPLCLGLGWGLDALARRVESRPAAPRLTRRAGLLAAAVLATLLLSASWRYAAAWRDQLAQARHTLAIFPDSVRAHINLARELYARQQLPEALATAREATRLGNDQALAWLWRGLTASGRGTTPNAALAAEAAAAYARCLELDPTQRLAWLHWARLERALGHAAAAREKLTRYLERATPAEQELAHREFGN